MSKAAPVGAEQLPLKEWHAEIHHPDFAILAMAGLGDEVLNEFAHLIQRIIRLSNPEQRPIGSPPSWDE